MIDNAMTARRAEKMKDSPQLTLGEIILKLEAMPDLDARVIFDFQPVSPDYLCSWRGSYNELAIVFGPVEASGNQVLATLRGAISETYDGWKGGEFKMGRLTPVWVVGSNGDSGVEISEDYQSLGIVDVKIDDGKIVLATQAVDY